MPALTSFRDAAAAAAVSRETKGDGTAGNYAFGVGVLVINGKYPSVFDPQCRYGVLSRLRGPAEWDPSAMRSAPGPLSVPPADWCAPQECSQETGHCG